jgi:hypothetical protein
VRLDEGGSGAFVEFSHPLTRAAIYDALPTARRSALNTAAARVVAEPAVAMRHRVEAATVVNEALLVDLESHAHTEMSRGVARRLVTSERCADIAHARRNHRRPGRQPIGSPGYAATDLASVLRGGSDRRDADAANDFEHTKHSRT